MLTAKQITQAANEAFALLFNIGHRKNLTQFLTFKVGLEKKIRCKISRREYRLILTKANNLSWKKSKCLITSIVICSNYLPGMPLFRRAHHLGAIAILPKRDDHFTLRHQAELLQKQVFDATEKELSPDATRVLPKASVLD